MEGGAATVGEDLEQQFSVRSLREMRRFYLAYRSGFRKFGRTLLPNCHRLKTPNTEGAGSSGYFRTNRRDATGRPVAVHSSLVDVRFPAKNRKPRRTKLLRDRSELARLSFGTRSSVIRSVWMASRSLSRHQSFKAKILLARSRRCWPSSRGS